MLAIPFLAYVCASGVEANGFVAAFAAGAAFRAVRGPAVHHELELAEDVAVFTSMTLWFVLGQLAQLVFSVVFH